MTQAMSSSSSWRSCPPRFGTARRPERETRGGQVTIVARRLGLELMPWQQHVADVALEIDPQTGRLAYREIVLTVPRRSGKSALLFAVLMHRMIAFEGGQVAAFTMQNGLQARMRLRREWKPLLDKSRALKDIYDPSMFSGAEALLFKNGSRLEVVSGTSSSGHGATLDLAVVDEAFDQPDDRLEQALRPAIRTQPNAQLWWVSTAGSPTDLWFKSKVEAARASADADSGTAIFEWSAAEDADAADPAVWWDCMPALGFVRPNGSGLTERDIAEEYRAMTASGSEDGFRRAYLNQWVAPGYANAIDPARWFELADPDGARGENPTFGVDIDEHRVAQITVLTKTGAGMRAEVASDPVPAHLLTARLGELVGRWGGQVAVPTVLLDEMTREGLPAVEVKASAWPQACGELLDALAAGSLRHGNQKALNDAIAAVRPGPTTTSGQRSFRLRDCPGAGPAFALIRALHGAGIDQPADFYMI